MSQEDIVALALEILHCLKTENDEDVIELARTFRQLIEFELEEVDASHKVSNLLEKAKAGILDRLHQHYLEIEQMEATVDRVLVLLKGVPNLSKHEMAFRELLQHLWEIKRCL